MHAAVMAQQPPPQSASYGPLPVRRKPVGPPMAPLRPSPSLAYDAQMGHSRSRTTSSGVLPPSSSSSATTATITTTTSSTMGSQYPPQAYAGSLRRTPTSSTVSTTGTPHRSNSGALRRSSSTRSGTDPTSYVALMRKQKATVWCDRAQYEDPRILAQQRQAKMRANMEVVGGHHHQPARNASGGSGVAAGVRAKVRHHGVPKAMLYAPVTMAGSGVPMRLSASEVDEGDVEDNGSLGGAANYHHHRTGSGRSSLGSGRRVNYAHGGRTSTSSTPPNGSSGSPGDGIDDVLEEETPMPPAATTTGNGNGSSQPPRDYFELTRTGLSGGSSGSSGERNFGDVGNMPQALPHAASQDKKKSADELHRRGSVDERTTTMSGGRLFIANPDLSD